MTPAHPTVRVACIPAAHETVRVGHRNRPDRPSRLSYAHSSRALVHRLASPPAAVHRFRRRRSIGGGSPQTPAVVVTNLPFLGHPRRQGWQRVSRGLYLPDALAADPVSRLRAWQLALPDTSAFTHLTAAELCGWWRPAEVDHPVFAAAWSTNTRVHRPGLVVSRHRPALPVQVVRGVRVTAPAETMLALARDLCLLDLVVLGDSALQLNQVTIDELERAAAQRRRGAPRLRETIPLLDGRSESAWESILRMLHWTAEVPVEPQHEIRDRSGRAVAWGDLRVSGTRRLHEYDGEGHRKEDQYRRDRRRERLLVDLEWQRVGFVASQVLYEAGDIIAGLDRLLGRTWDPRRLNRWHQLLDESMLQPPGLARVRARWA